MRAFLIFIILNLGGASALWAQSLPDYNYLYQLDNPYRLLAQYLVGDSASSQLQLRILTAAPNQNFRWWFQESLSDSLAPSSSQQVGTDAQGWLRVPADSSRLQANSWLIVQPQAAPEKLIPVWLAPAKKFGASPLYPQLSQPTQNPIYQATAEKLALAGLSARDTLYLFGYQEDFNPATTPMSVPSPGDMLVTTRLLSQQPDTLELGEEGFYFLQTDTSKLAGIGLRVVSPYFPQMRRVKNFAAPLRYLSTQEEWNELQRADFNKEALDRFWFRMTQSQDLAKKIIRAYYRRVAAANQLFTGFKEGWKTDQGMIYILYGPPATVHLLPNGDQEWEYAAREAIPPISFTFQRSLNPFTEPYFQLVRNRNYARTHYQVINRWRRGTDLK